MTNDISTLNYAKGSGEGLNPKQSGMKRNSSGQSIPCKVYHVLLITVVGFTPNPLSGPFNLCNYFG